MFSTQEFITAIAQTIASEPRDVLVTNRNGKYLIDGHPRDIGTFIGKKGATILSIECLARQLEGAAKVSVCREHAPVPPNGYLGLRSDWSQSEEHRLKANIQFLLRFLYPDATVNLQPDLRASIYVVGDTQILPDVVGALTVIFRAHGRRHGRNITVTIPESVNV